MLVFRLLGPALLCALSTSNLSAQATQPTEVSTLVDAPSATLQQQQEPPHPPGWEPPPPNETGEQRKARELREEATREVKAQEQQRILAVAPNFYTVLNGYGVALSKGQKTELAWKTVVDPFNVVSAFLVAGYSEVTHGHIGYGWGPGGYFKRVGANGADLVSSTMFTGAVYPILLKQDPRFFRQGQGGFKSRIKHALVAPYVCRGDNGHRQPNYSNVLGNLTAGALSNAYYPADERSARLTFQNAATVLVEGSLGNIGLEFIPDLEDWWNRKHGRQPNPANVPKSAPKAEPAPAAPSLQKRQ